MKDFAAVANGLIYHISRYARQSQREVTRIRFGIKNLSLLITEGRTSSFPVDRHHITVLNEYLVQHGWVAFQIDNAEIGLMLLKSTDNWTKIGIKIEGEEDVQEG